MGKRIIVSITPMWGAPPRILTLGYARRDEPIISYARMRLDDAEFYGVRRCLRILHRALRQGHTPGSLVFNPGQAAVEAGHF